MQWCLPDISTTFVAAFLWSNVPRSTNERSCYLRSDIAVTSCGDVWSTHWWHGHSLHTGQLHCKSNSNRCTSCGVLCLICLFCVCFSALPPSHDPLPSFVSADCTSSSAIASYWWMASVTCDDHRTCLCCGNCDRTVSPTCGAHSCRSWVDAGNNVVMCSRFWKSRRL